MDALAKQGIAQIFLIRKSLSLSGNCVVLAPCLKSFVDYAALALVLLYFVRNSIFPLPPNFIFYSAYGILTFSILWMIAVAGVNQLNVFSVLFLVGCLMSSVVSPYYEQSIQKAIGLVMLVCCLGPVIWSNGIAKYRLTAWSVCRLTILFFGLTSIPWYFLRLPNFGMGFFSGLLSHCILASVVAAMACLVSFLLAFERKSLFWAMASILCLAPTLAAGSRGACLSLAAGLLVALIFIFPKKRFFFYRSLVVGCAYCIYLRHKERSDQ